MKNDASLKLIDAQIKDFIAQGGASVKNADVTTAAGAPGIDLLGAQSTVVLDTPWTTSLLRLENDVTGIMAQWYEILGSTGRFGGAHSGGAQEGMRGGQIEWSSTPRSAYYKTLAKDYAVTDEQYYAQKGIMDPRSFGVNGALIEAKREHHRWNLFGRTTTQTGGVGGIGKLGAVSGAGSAGAGSIPAATYYVAVVPLNGEADYRTRTYLPNSAFSGPSGAVFGSEILNWTRTNGDGTTTPVSGGAGIASNEITVTLSATGAIVLSWKPLLGACGYAVFVGTATGAEVFQGTVQTASVTLTSLKTGSSYQTLGTNFTSDNSTDALVYDGILSLLGNSNSPSGYTALDNGASLTSSADFTLDVLAGPLAILARTFDGYGPDRAVMGPQTARSVNLALLTNASSSVAPKTVYMLQDGDIDNVVHRPIINPSNSKKIEILVDPYFPEGKIMLEPRSIPSMLQQNVSAPVAFRPQWDYWGEVWPRTTRKVANGVSLRGTLVTPWRAGFWLVDNVPYQAY